MVAKIRNRIEIVALLRKRDGDSCQYPGCEKPVDFTPGGEGRMSATIDHWMPQYWCKEQGWTDDQIWDVSNLKIMHKGCNAAKGGRIPNEDGTLPPKRESRFKYRSQKRAGRAALCTLCESGRLLLIDETCPDCGSGPQPAFPSAYQLPANECPHEGPWSCFACMVGIVDRKPAFIDVFDIEESGIDD